MSECIPPIALPVFLRVHADLPGLAAPGLPVRLRVHFDEDADATVIEGILLRVEPYPDGGTDTIGVYEHPRIGRGRYHAAGLEVRLETDFGRDAAARWLRRAGHPVPDSVLQTPAALAWSMLRVALGQLPLREVRDSWGVALARVAATLPKAGALLVDTEAADLAALAGRVALRQADGTIRLPSIVEASPR